MGGEDVVAEEVIVDGDEPVGQRRLFEITDAVDVQRDPVAADGHVLGGIGVRGVGVVEQWRAKRARQSEPQQRQAAADTRP